MALPDIIKKILEEAESEVSRIELNIEAQKKEIQKQAEIQKKADAETIKAKMQSAFESIEKKMQSLIRRESAKKQLEMKHEIIQSLLHDFLKSIENADENTYGKILEKLFAKTSVTSGKVYAPAQRMEITSKKAPQGFDVVTHKDISGGFILETGGIKIDNTFKTLLFEEFTEDFILYFSEELKLS